MLIVPLKSQTNLWMTTSNKLIVCNKKYEKGFIEGNQIKKDKNIYFVTVNFKIFIWCSFYLIDGYIGCWNNTAKKTV